MEKITVTYLGSFILLCLSLLCFALLCLRSFLGLSVDIVKCSHQAEHAVEVPSNRFVVPALVLEFTITIVEMNTILPIPIAVFGVFYEGEVQCKIAVDYEESVDELVRQLGVNKRVLGVYIQRHGPHARFEDATDNFLRYADGFALLLGNLSRAEEEVRYLRMSSLTLFALAILLPKRYQK